MTPLTQQESMLHVHCARKCVSADHELVRTHIGEINHVMLMIMMFPKVLFNIILIIKFKQGK